MKTTKQHKWSITERICTRGDIRKDMPSSAYKMGDEFKPFHPGASHVRPEWRDGWNACFIAALAALQAEPQPEADMFWDSDDGESFGHSIQDLIAERDVGEVVTVDRAMRLPSIKVRVISGETDEDNTWEEVRPATPPKD